MMLRKFMGLSTLLVFAGCNSAAYKSYERAEVTPPPFVTETTKIFFYPNQAQTEQRQDRDRYECYLWSAKKSGFDPAQAQLAPHQRVEVVPQPAAGSDATAGAIAGAITGSLLADRNHREEGLVLGAIAGSILGAASDAERERNAAQAERQINSGRYARIERGARDYRRAMTACLEGRGYTVR